ncbi:Fur family transcriptional regulator [Pseudooceanicola sp.]|uniref:Fur family transcriptional regulator n=1 Tax=Pseudooceanicola sp. TaxID=1914328 RepID=UPI0035C72B52
MEAAGFAPHDHAACVHQAISAAEDYCETHKLRFTPVRRRVLEILLEEHRALGAYEILERLKQEGHAAQPPVAYRCLDFLVRYGFAHRIERLNAFIACADPNEDHFPAFLICRVCDSVAETTPAPSRGLLGSAARDVGFQIEQTTVEAIGVCPDCREAGTPA